MKSGKGVLLGVVIFLLALCGPAIIESLATPGSSMKPDQVNTTGWDRAWTNLANDVQQSFQPSMPKLLAVEVDLRLEIPAHSEDDLTLTILDAKGQELAVITETVQASHCDHAIFVISKHGIDVQPGQTYRIKLSGGMLFGWKYIVGGYEQGSGNLLLRPLLAESSQYVLVPDFRRGSKTRPPLRRRRYRSGLAPREMPPRPQHCHSPDLSIPCSA